MGLHGRGDLVDDIALSDDGKVCAVKGGSGTQD
jgi:hypothetical protein